ncbi:polymeric immunoglobulin receptor isoform X2 [Pseudorasbora parva]|uniref:polymeric immunoglobulin receptor isoform X2 n=1 Tax=Pseudorasbora parva TaxID=51549 RepID=UPI00351EDE7B
MKTVLFFLFFTLCLIKGHMSDAADVVTGGSVIIKCLYDPKKSQTRESAKSFCKVSGNECTTMTEVNNDLWIPEERFSMTENKSVGFISVLIRNLTVNDSGTYKCKGVQDVNLDVKQEPCCGSSEELTAYILTTAVIHCKYPEKYKDHPKLLFKVQNGSLEVIITVFGSSTTDGRFSLNVNEQEHFFTASITDVSRHDAGVYFCGIDHSNQIYTHLLTEIRLHVSDLYITIIIITACLILLLAVGLSLLLIKRRCKKTEGSVSADQRNTTDGDEVITSAYYEAIQDCAQDSIGLNTVYASAHLPTSPSDSDFYTLVEKPQNTES